MNSLLQQAIAGEPVTVTLGGQTYPLAFPMQAVILYKSETALLDRERTQGRPRLSLEEQRSLRTRRQLLLADADRLRPGKGEDWQPERFLEYDSLNDEATALKTELDEDAGGGDSLYNMYNWRKISPDADPERVLLALWVGLHTFTARDDPMRSRIESVKYEPTLSKTELGKMINLGNGGDLTMAISKALSAHLIAPREEEAAVISQPSDPSEEALVPNSPAEVPPQHLQGIEERRHHRRPPAAEVEAPSLTLSKKIPK